MPQMHVNAAALNIRSGPNMTSDNILATLPFGHPLETTGEHDLKRWIAVEATLNGKSHKGFVNMGYLRNPLSASKEELLAQAASIRGFSIPAGGASYVSESLSVAKPAICDVICTHNHNLVVARGLTQVWALTSGGKIVKFPLLEDGRLDDSKGVVKAVLRNQS
jgi:Bacterial SH3 domain